MPRVFVSVGSNVDRERHLRGGLADLARAFAGLRCSPVYESEPVGFTGDPFYNLVASFETELPVEAVETRLSAIEDRHGRVRDGERFGPRTLDLDLLLYGDLVVDGPGLRLPRAEILEYAFVLKPLADLAPELLHPLAGRTLAQLWAERRGSTPPLAVVDFPTPC